MKAICLVPLLAVLTLGSMPYRPYEAPRARNMDRVDVYAVASAMSGAPVEVLKSIALAESSMGTNLRHSNRHDRGYYGLHEKPAYHAERVKKYGEYSADDPIESGRVAGRIYLDHLARFGSPELALTAYHRGAKWTLANGVDWKYIKRTRGKK
jgi:hypothetical protein